MTAQYRVGVVLSGESRTLVAATRQGEKGFDDLGAAAERAGEKIAASRPKIFDRGSGETMKKEAVEAEAALKKVLASLDPVYAKQLKFERGQAALAQALDAGVISLQQYNLGLANLEARLVKPPKLFDRDAMKKEAVEAEAALGKLLVAIDPVYARQVKLEQGQAVVNRALKAGVIDQAQYNLALANLETRLGLIEPRLSRLAQLRSFIAGVLGGIVGGGVYGVIDRALGLIGAFIDKLDAVGPRIAKLVSDSRTFGFSVAQIQGLDLGARQARFEPGEAAQGLKKFDEVLRDAAVGEGKHRHFLEQLGIQARDANGEVIKVADAMKILVARWREFSAADRRTLAEAFFGDAKFAALVENFEGWSQSASKLGTALRQDVAEAAKETHDRLHALNEVSNEKLQAQFDRMGVSWAKIKMESRDALTFLLRVAEAADPRKQQEANAETGKAIGAWLEREFETSVALLKRALGEAETLARPILDKLGEQGAVALAAIRKVIDPIVEDVRGILGESDRVVVAIGQWAPQLATAIGGFRQALGLVREIADVAGGLGGGRPPAANDNPSSGLGHDEASGWGHRFSPLPTTQLKGKPAGGAGGGRGDEAGRTIEEMAQRIHALDAALAGGKVAGELAKVLAVLDRAGATAMQKNLAKAYFDDERMKQGLLALKDMEREHRRNAEAIEAEIAGNHALAETIRLKAQIEREHGAAFVAAHGERIAAIAEERLALQRSADQHRALTGEIVNLAGSSLEALREFATAPWREGETAAKRFQDTVKRIVDDVIRVLYQLSVVNPLQNWLDGGSRPTISTLFGRLFGGLFGGGGVPDTVPDAVRADVMHGGGLVGAGGYAARLVAAHLFAGAPRHHAGFAPGERPAVLLDDEGVFTPRQMDNAGALIVGLSRLAARPAGAVELKIVDQRGRGAPDLETRETRGADGRRVVEVTIRDQVRRDLAEGAFDAPLKNRFGLQARA